jgi:ABC-type sugar transport system permease subunit
MTGYKEMRGYIFDIFLSTVISFCIALVISTISDIQIPGSGIADCIFLVLWIISTFGIYKLIKRRSLNPMIGSLQRTLRGTLLIRRRRITLIQAGTRYDLSELLRDYHNHDVTFTIWIGTKVSQHRFI